MEEPEVVLVGVCCLTFEVSAFHVACVCCATRERMREKVDGVVVVEHVAGARRDRIR